MLRLLRMCFFILSLCELPAFADEPQGAVISFDVERPGRVSAAVYDAEGNLVRELLLGATVSAGTQTVIWDGLGRGGESLPAGQYVWKSLETPGLKAKYLLSVGTNFPPGTEWNTACGPGTHAAPFGVAVDETGIYVAAHTTENIETCVLKLAPDGQSRAWSALHPTPWDGALSLASDGGELFMLGHVRMNDARIEPEKVRKQRVYVFDAATGKLAPRTQVNSAVGLIPIKLDVQWDQNSDDMDANDMDAHNGALVVAYEKRNALRWYHPQSGDLVATVDVEAPTGVTIASSGDVYVSSQDKIVRLSRAEPKPVTIVAELDQPGRIDFDHGTNELLVYLAGSQQIQRYSPDGKLLATYGETGGRRDGLYDATTSRSFAGFADLCADGSGGFYVTESTTAPRRTAHFANDGSVIREWYGGQRWAPHAAPEGDNPNVLWVGSQYGWIMRVMVDYEQKSWKVHSCYKYTGLADGLIGDSHNEGCYFRVYRHAGSTYLALEQVPTILKVDEQAWKLVPATIYGNVSSLKAELKETGQGQQTYQWNDANGDGAMQRDEFTFYASGMTNSYEPYIAPDFTCYTVSQDRLVRKFPVTRWTTSGAPVYGEMPQGQVVGTCSPRFDPNHFADARWSAFLHHDPQSGRLYAALNDWTRDWCDYNDSFMHCWSAKGDSLWTVGQRSAGPGRALPGDVQTHLRGVAGVAHDCVVAIDVNGGWFGGNTANTYVWDRDGLFVGGLMDDPDLIGIAPFWYQCGGEFCHSAVHTLPSGDVLFYGNWENEVRVYQISGWQDWTRQTGQIQLRQPNPAHTGVGLTAAYFDDVEMTRPRRVMLDRRPGLARDEQSMAVRWTGTVEPAYGPAYLGPWTSRSNKECFDGTTRGSRDNGASVAVRFRGTSIEVVGSRGSNYGFAQVSLDGEEPTCIDCYSPTAQAQASLFSREGLPDADHEITLTVAGWFGQPRNPASSDAWVYVDKFVVDGRDVDDAGIEHTFFAQADGLVQLWINREPVLNEQSSGAELAGQPIKLLRRANSIQLACDGGGAQSNSVLSWSTLFESKHPIPPTRLFPLIPGGHTLERLPLISP
ncbi:MAG: FlgD immunoglobulin-like domain containing protein [Planctomycetaceae bacterium]